MKIVFITIENEWGGCFLGPLYLASYLRKYRKDVDIKIINKNYLSEIEKFNPDIIGISSVSNEFYEVNNLAKRIKKRWKDIPLVIGGVHITMVPKDFMKTVFDVGVIAEGEITFLELINQLEKDGNKVITKNLKSINGLVFRNDNKLYITKRRGSIKNLDEIPIPAYDLLDMKKLLLPGPAKRRLIGIRGYLMTSRGCPYNCVFCSSKAFWKNARYHSEERIVDEIEIWVNKYHVDHMIIQDDLFVFSKPRIKKIIKLMKERNILGKTTFEVLGRANHIDKEMVDLLAELNVNAVSFGFESGSERVLNYLKRGTVTVEQGVNAIKLCREKGFLIHGLFIIGSPGETEEDLKLTLKFIRENKMDIIAIFHAMPCPGTDFWDKAMEYGVIDDTYYEQSNRGNMKELNLDFILTQEIPRNKYGEWFKLFKEEQKKNNSRFKYKFKLRGVYIQKMLSYKFIEKLLMKDKNKLKWWVGRLINR